jgi:hypothetical protein
MCRPTIAMDSRPSTDGHPSDSRKKGRHVNPLHTIELARLHRLDLERDARHRWIRPSTERPPRRFATVLRHLPTVGEIRASLARPVRG